MPSKMIDSDLSDLTAKDKELISAEIKGTTLRVYHFLMKIADLGPREIQRELELSSPSVAVYHLTKLVDWGLIEKTPQGRYNVIVRLKIGILKQFIDFKGLLIPRFASYAVFFTVIFIGYLIFFAGDISDWFSRTAKIFVWIVSIPALVVFWLEAYFVYQQKPV
ncbi:MAG: winged helix-turn-helix domain-containing protein [Candidatus Kariarchaeaceae archaeon]